MRYFSLYSETYELDNRGYEITGSLWLMTSDKIEDLFEHIRVKLQKDEDWVFKIVRDAEEEK